MASLLFWSTVVVFVVECFGTTTLSVQHLAAPRARSRSDPPLRAVELVLAGGGDARPTDRVAGDINREAKMPHRGGETI